MPAMIGRQQQQQQVAAMLSVYSKRLFQGAGGLLPIPPLQRNLQIPASKRLPSCVL